MLAIAGQRTAGYQNVAFHEGQATALPVDDGAFDRVVSVQVLEYIDDATGALAEMHRALRPGGRLVVWDVDWSTVSWHSADPTRMRNVLSAWDGHLVHPALPRTLTARLRAAGFTDVSVDGHVFATNELSRESYGGAMIGVLRNYVGSRPDVVPTETLDAWSDEQSALDAAGEFFFSVVQFCFTATRPL